MLAMHKRLIASLLLLLPLAMPSLATPDSFQQIPLSSHMEEAALPSSDSMPESSTLLLSDILTLQLSASIFYSYARETRLSEEYFANENERATILAPTNKAVMALARKPHQGPESQPIQDGTIISEEEIDETSKKNVENWISAHIIPRSPIQLSPTSQFETLLKGCVVSVSEAEHYADASAENPEWARVVLNGNISVISRHEAANGVLYLIDGAIYG